MMLAPVRVSSTPLKTSEARLSGMIDYLRSVMVANPVSQERFHVIFLDDQRRYISASAMGRGAINALTVRIRELFRSALAVNASAIIVAHNHPSGVCRPSTIDIAETRRLAAIARALDIELVDHLIFTQECLYSMRAGGDI